MILTTASSAIIAFLRGGEPGRRQLIAASYPQAGRPHAETGDMRNAPSNAAVTSIPRTVVAAGLLLTRARQCGLSLPGVTGDEGDPGEPVHDESDAVQSDSRPLVSARPSAASAPASLVGLWNNPKLPDRVARCASCPHHSSV